MKKVTRRQIAKMDRIAFALEALQNELRERDARISDQIGQAKRELTRALDAAQR